MAVMALKPGARAKEADQKACLSSGLSVANEPLLSIRPAVESDVPALIRLLRRSWLVTWAPELPFYAVQAFAAADPVPAVVEARWPIMWVAVIGKRLAGRVDVEGDRLENIEVDPAMWRQGIGQTLLAHSESLIVRSHAVAFLEVRAFNARAIRFYCRHGWKEVRRYPGTECGAPVENIEMSKSICAAHPPRWRSCER